jgi:hypothetical protein
MPAILLLLFASLQVAAWFVARATAMNAAQAAVTAQRGYDAPAGVGEEKADEFLAAAGDWLVDSDVTVNPGPVDVTATVTGEALHLVPFMTFHVRQQAHGTVERFTPEVP